jgi:hypothetical protein
VQWHNMGCAVLPPTSMQTMSRNTTWDASGWGRSMLSKALSDHSCPAEDSSQWWAIVESARRSCS